MQPEDELEPMERELAESLRRLSPAAVAVDPVAAAFVAGGRRARRQTRIWQGATVLAVALWGTGWMVPGDRAEKSGRQTTAIVENDAERAAAPLPEQSVFMLQKAVLAHGLDGLPAAEHAAVKVLHIEDLL
jgi:hypothetical protein